MPVVNLLAAVLLPQFWIPAITCRRDEWLKEFADDFDQHREECNIENLVKDEAFVSAFIELYCYWNSSGRKAPIPT